MLIQSQPVDPEVSKKLGSDDESKKMAKSEIKNLLSESKLLLIKQKL